MGSLLGTAFDITVDSLLGATVDIATVSFFALASVHFLQSCIDMFALTSLYFTKFIILWLFCDSCDREISKMEMLNVAMIRKNDTSIRVSFFVCFINSPEYGKSFLLKI